MDASTQEIQKQAILVSGMHRSGTSALTRTLNLLGAGIGPDLLPPAADNPTGFWEHRGVNALQDRILDALDREWLDVTPLPAGWMNLEKVQPLLAELEEILRRDFLDSSLWAIKDPRICLLLPAWGPILQRMQCRGTCALIVRNPVEVIQSLEKRNRLSPERLYMLWLRHLLDSERHSREWPRVIVSYRRLLNDWRGEIETMTRRLQVRWPVQIDEVSAKIDEFLQPSLRHHTVSDEQVLNDESVPRMVRDVYRVFVETEQGDTPEFQSRLDAIRADLEDNRGLVYAYLGALQREARKSSRDSADVMKRLQETNAQLVEINVQAIDARAQLTKSHSEVTAAHAQVADAHARVANAHAQVADAQAHVADAQAQLAAADARVTVAQGSLEQQQQLLLQTQVELTQERSAAQLLREELSSQTQKALQTAQELEERGRQISGLRLELSQQHQLLEQARAQDVRAELQETRRTVSGLQLRATALDRVLARVYVSLGWRATEWLRSLRRHLQPRQFVKSDLMPSSQLLPSGKDQWTVIGTGGYFLAPMLPMSNWMRLKARVWSSVRGRMELYFDNGSGMDLGEVWGNTVVSVLVRVPNGTRVITWVPLDRSGEIRVEQWDLFILPTWLVYLRLTGRTTQMVGFKSVLRGIGLLARGRFGEFLMHLRTALPPTKSQTRVSEEPGKTAPAQSSGAAPAAPDAALAGLLAQQIQTREVGVNFYSPLAARSGLGMAGRGYARALAATALPFESHEVPSWKTDDHRDDSFFTSTQLPGEPTPGYRINLIHQNCDAMPLFIKKYGPGVLKGKYNIGMWVWELPALRTDWQQYFHCLDEIWAPSEFVRQSVLSISPVPVIRVPHVVDGLEATATHNRAHFNLPDDVFLILFPFDVSSYMERKNPFPLIDAFKRVFGNSRDVMLILKYHSGNYNPDTVRIMQKAADAPNIRLMPGLLSDDEVLSLHRVTDALVSPHRAEGFGLNIAESMYFGKAVVATAYSGNVDFMLPDNSYPVDYDLVAIEKNIGPYFRDHVWASPKFDDLCEKLEFVFRDDAQRRKRGEAARRTIREMLSVDTVSRIMRGRFDELGLTARVDESLFRRAKKEIIEVPARRRGIDYDVLSQCPVISVITPVYNVPADLLHKCIKSVLAQSYPNWELCICDDQSTDPATIAVLERFWGTDPRIKTSRNAKNLGISGASNRAVELSSGPFIAMLDNDDELHPDALYWVAKAINEFPSADLIYTDEDKLEMNGEHSEHYYKPDWSPEHLRSVMYLLHLLVVRKNLFLKLGMFRTEYAGAQDYDLALRISEVTDKIVHVPQVLYHWRKIPGSAAETVDAKPYALLAGKRALQDHLKRVGVEAEVVDGRLQGTFRVRPKINGNPPVTLVIIAGGRVCEIEGHGSVDLVRNFVRSIRQQTSYPNYRILVVDDGNLSAEQRADLAALACTMVTCDRGQAPFNFSRKVNFACAQVQTEHLVLLNDDMEVIDGDWLTALLEFSQASDVGAVGGRLLMPDRRIQHAGIVLGVNNGAAHIYHGSPANITGYGGFPNLIRNFSAVTGACLATRKSIIRQVGGFDERFAIDYNDVSFCLAVRKAGYRIVYTPFCELLHFESVSAKRTVQCPAEVELFHRLWRDQVVNDPYYNPNLPRNRHDFVLE